MKMQSKSTLYGLKPSFGEVEGNKYDFTTFYLPAEFATNTASKAIGCVTVPYKFGDSTEFDKWAHLANSWPVGGLPVDCEFDVVLGKDAKGKDAPKLVLLGIKPRSLPAAAPLAPKM